MSFHPPVSFARPLPVINELLRALAFALLTGTIIAEPMAAPRIDQLTALPDGEVAVTGTAFGARCARCEVQADYGAGWRYALAVSNWSDTRIIARLPDLNAGLDVSLRVHNATGTSNSGLARVQRARVPSKDLHAPVRGPIAGLRVFNLSSTLKVGASGEESFDVSAPPARCGESALLFEEARLFFERQRFAQAAIIAAPAAGCSTCVPLRVRWYQEPTGHLDLQVHVYHRRVEGICPQRKRP